MKQIVPMLILAAMAFMVSCNSTSLQEKQALMAQQNTIDSLKLEMAKKQIIDSMNEMAKVHYVIPQIIEPIQTQPVKRRVTRTRKVSNEKSYVSSQPAPQEVTSNAPVYQDAPIAATSPVAQEIPVEEEKKGWSAKAKGAVIGAGTGAIAGAVINKRNRTVGAVIGGVLGAGAGTGIGAVIDRKNGR